MKWIARKFLRSLGYHWPDYLRLHLTSFEKKAKKLAARAARDKIAATWHTLNPEYLRGYKAGRKWRKKR